MGQEGSGCGNKKTHMRDPCHVEIVKYFDFGGKYLGLQR